MSLKGFHEQNYVEKFLIHLKQQYEQVIDVHMLISIQLNQGIHKVYLPFPFHVPINQDEINQDNQDDKIMGVDNEIVLSSYLQVMDLQVMCLQVMYVRVSQSLDIFY